MLYRRGREIEGIGDLFYAHSAKESEFNDIRLARKIGAQLLERIFQVHEIRRELVYRKLDTSQGRRSLPAAPLYAFSAPGVIDEYLSHRSSSRTKEVGAATGRDLLLIDEAQVCFVDEGRRAERIGLSLSHEIDVRERPQLVVDEREDSVNRGPFFGLCSLK